MTILEKIRSKATLLAIVIGIAIFSFIIGDFLHTWTSFFNQKKENIAIVNGETINYQDFLLRIENQINTIKENNNKSLTDNEQHQIRQTILNEIIDDILLAKETKKLGLVISKKEYKDLVIGNHISPILQQISNFQNSKTKKFDKVALLQFLQLIENEDYSIYSEEQIAQLLSIKKKWEDIKNQILKEQLKKKLNTLLSYSILTNNLEAKLFYENNKVNVDFDYVAKSYNSISDKEVKVSNSEIQKLYNRQKKFYKQQEITIIDYVLLNIIPSKKDYQIIENKLKELKKQLESSKDIAKIVQTNSDIPYTDTYVSYNNLNKNQKYFINKNSVGMTSCPILTDKTFDLYKFEGIKFGPDSIKLNVLMISPITSNEFKFTHKCDSLVQIIKSGTPFTKIALDISKGKTTGELGWMTESQLTSKINNQFANEAFKAKINEPTIIKFNLGTFLIQVIKKTQPIKKYKIADIQIHVTPSQDTKMYLYNKLNQIISSNLSFESLKKNAKFSNFNFQTNVKILKNQICIHGIQNSRKIIQWAFHNKKNTISDIFECQNGEYFIVAIIKKHLKKGHYLSESLFNTLKRKLINKKKAIKLINKFKTKNINTLKQCAKLMNTKPQSVQSINLNTFYIPSIGVEPILNAKILKVNKNQIFGPYVGKNKIYILYITNRNINKELYNVKYFQKQAHIQNMYHIYKIIQSPKFLREVAKIDNYYDRFF